MAHLLTCAQLQVSKSSFLLLAEFFHISWTSIGTTRLVQFYSTWSTFGLMVVAVFQESKRNYLRLFSLAQTAAVLFGQTQVIGSAHIQSLQKHTPPLDGGRCKPYCEGFGYKKQWKFRVILKIHLLYTLYLRKTTLF